MPWVFAGIVLVNIFFGAWNLLRGDGSAGADSVRPSDAGGAPLYLLAERPDLAVERQKLRKEGQGQAESAATNQSVSASVGKACYLVGPLQESAVTTLQARLSTHGLKADSRLLEATGEEYWVYIPPFRYSDDADAKAAFLRKKGIESQVLKDGPFARAISVSHVATRGAADQLVGKLSELGLQPEIRTIKKSGRDHWLYVYAETAKVDVKGALAKSLPSGQEIRKEIAPCEE